MFERMYIDGIELRGLEYVENSQALLDEVTLPAGSITVVGENLENAAHGYTERVISVYYDKLPDGIGGQYSTLGRWEEDYVQFSCIKYGMQTDEQQYKLFSINYNTESSPFPGETSQLYYKSKLVDKPQANKILQTDWYAKFKTYADLVAFATSVSLPVPITDEALFSTNDLVGLTPGIRLKYYYQER